MEQTIDSKKFLYPPGGILIWIIIMLELVTFGVALIAMAVYGSQDTELYHRSRLLLNPIYGTINTLILITSGYFMAISVRKIKMGQLENGSKHLFMTMLFGLLFLIVKVFEYQSKLNAGLDIGYNSFFTFYWLLTLFHVVHVLVGLVILFSIYKGLNKKRKTAKMEDIEAGAAFWHMCDLIWLLLFPVIYLIF